MALSFTSYGGVSVNAGTPYFLFSALDAERGYTADTFLRDRDGDSPLVEGDRLLPEDRRFVVTRGDTSVPASVDEWVENVGSVFKPDGVARALRATWRGVTIEVMASVISLTIPSGITRTDSTDIEIGGVFRIADPIWRAVTAAGPDSASPIALAGNVSAQPVYTITGDTTEVFRRRVTITDVLGLGLNAYPIVATMDTTAGTTLGTANFIAFHQGREIPIYVVNPDNASTKVFFRVDCPPGSSTYVDVYYGASVSNTVTAQAFDPAGMAITDASFSNSNWVWDNFIVSDNPINVCGAWVLARIAAGGNTFGTDDVTGIDLTEAAGSLTWRYNTGTDEPTYDAVVMVIGGALAGTSSAFSGVSRQYSDVSSGNKVTFRVDYQTLTSLDLQSALAETGDNTTITTAIDLDNAIAIIMRATRAGTGELQTVIVAPTGDFALALTSNPTVSVASAVTARVIDDSLDLGTGDTFDMDRLFVDNVALTVDTLNRTISPASGPIYARDLVMSNQRGWLPMPPGSNSWTEPDNTAVSVTARESYRVV